MQAIWKGDCLGQQKKLAVQVVWLKLLLRMIITSVHNIQNPFHTTPWHHPMILWSWGRKCSLNFSLIATVHVFCAWWFHYPGRLLWVWVVYCFIAGELMLLWLWGAIAGHACRSRGGPWVQFPVASLNYSSFSWLTNVDTMNDLWCSSVVWLLCEWMWRPPVVYILG